LTEKALPPTVAKLFIFQEKPMETAFINASLINLALNLSYTVISLFVAVAALMVIDKVLLKKLDIQQELANNNLAVAIFCSALMIFVALIICFGLQH
jgi:hypothetical protein